jgi:hypothetical protein
MTHDADLIGGAFPDAPGDHTTITAVLDHYAAAGFAGEFEVEDGPTVICSACGAASPADHVSRESVRRLEGASDPDDMVAIAAIVCPACATRGVLVLGFGPSSSLTDAETLSALRDGSADSDLPPDAAPGESTDSQ